MPEATTAPGPALIAELPAHKDFGGYVLSLKTVEVDTKGGYKYNLNTERFVAAIYDVMKAAAASTAFNYASAEATNRDSCKKLTEDFLKQMSEYDK